MDMNTLVSILPNEIVDMICFKFKGLQHPFFKITDEFIEIRRNKILIFEYAKLKKNLWFDEYTIVEAENWADDLMDRITYGDSMLQLYTGNEVRDEYLYDEDDRIYQPDEVAKYIENMYIVKNVFDKLNGLGLVFTIDEETVDWDIDDETETPIPLDGYYYYDDI